MKACVHSTLVCFAVLLTLKLFATAVVLQARHHSHPAQQRQQQQAAASRLAAPAAAAGLAVPQISWV
jgi:hypothetical protein